MTTELSEDIRRTQDSAGSTVGFRFGAGQIRPVQAKRVSCMISNNHMNHHEAWHIAAGFAGQHQKSPPLTNPGRVLYKPRLGSVLLSSLDVSLG